ncbi:MAG TPA: phospholipase D-like domain-containing protein, partial [Opitutaceae bacterium]|nr:phospholipase D-like domain-containing protein [Opitutaceae bacterium]
MARPPLSADLNGDAAWCAGRVARIFAGVCSRPALLAGLLAAGMLFLGGCASLPDTHFLKHRYSVQAAEFQSAWGPISAKRSAAIVDELKRTSGNLDILDRQIALEQALVGQPLVLGNQVKLLQDGPATYRAMFAAIEGARHTINVESYIIGDDRIGRKFADALLARQAAGVQVNVIYDSFGAFGTPRSFFERLRRGGIRVLEFNPFNPFRAHGHWDPNHRDHRKLMVVDGRTAFLGGINIDGVYSSGSSGAAKRRLSKRLILSTGWR